MSIDNTNTPNGDSKKLNEINSDKGIVNNVASISELNPEIEIVEQVDGKATVINKGDYYSVPIDARKSELTIPLISVGPKLPISPENIASIKKYMKEFKENEFFKKKGAMTLGEYVKYIKEKAEKEDRASDNREDSLDNNR